MKYVSGPYFEPDFDPVLDRLGTPGVVVDNETREDCSLVKVDSVNRDGVLLEMIGRKLTDPSLPGFIQRALLPFQRSGSPKFTTCLGNVVGPGGPDVSDCASLEFTVHDRPGLLSSITQTRVTIDNWEERGYAIVKMTSRDRPKLLFDTVCALTDMHYVVFHATVGAQGPLAIQEYYIRHKDGRTVDSDAERQKVSRCLVAAVERRASHGVRVEVRAPDRSGLLSDFTRMLREHGLSLLRVEIKRQKEEAIGTFFLVTDTGGEVRPEALCAVRTRVAEMGISLDVAKGAPGWPPVKKTRAPAASLADQERPRSSLGSLLWSHLGKLSNNFGLIRS
ncbi:hypothetical protein TRIUR3_25195 [Triticum urartu]|uniref:ACT domain-containing protein ACR n=1 Tax=Triticum urartu TaxID=4572 RepID=M7Z6B0_TRIUA|nr:hypothetical protein TRIUR3_25195 [Triticum urartu]